MTSALMMSQDVVRSWYSRLPSMVQNAQQLVWNSEECARACLDGETSSTALRSEVWKAPLTLPLSAGSLPALGRVLNRSWQQKKLMAPGCEPASVRLMMEVLQPLVLGQSLVGAGGGGFLCLLTRQPQQLGAVHQALSSTPVSLSGVRGQVL